MIEVLGATEIGRVKVAVLEKGLKTESVPVNVGQAKPPSRRCLVAQHFAQVWCLRTKPTPSTTHLFDSLTKYNLAQLPSILLHHHHDSIIAQTRLASS
jgi:hypothetical protein